ncbi:major facilitator superfamily MFS_1 [Paraburkholderia atlantica]|uniref:Major facilitator superfamily MFS_1 n=1 Tax=Paraburkholderia atlantica TaxID=2654982 RepID=D5WI69_PARAM|nr:MFS transporter [Paraburkholderia atlantica]ADG18164.1 major facilitator superfamily MFS_1 [Paraburkholderia atlantica]
MNRPVDSLKGWISLVLCHCSGLIDLVAMPVWIGIVLIGMYGLSPQSAGALVSCFLGAAVISSAIVSPRADRIRGARAVPLGYGVAAAAFIAMATTRDYNAMILLHLVGGLGVGVGLSMAHATMGASSNPHRLIAVAFLALTMVSLGFLGGVSKLVVAYGGPVLFLALGCIMLVTALFALIGFPSRRSGASHLDAPVQHGKLRRVVWFAMIGTSFALLNHSMMFGFVERVGDAHGFSRAQLMNTMLAIGLVNLSPGILATFFEKKISPKVVIVFGPALHAMLCLMLTQTTVFGVYTVGACLFPVVMTFTHTFIFAYLARLDPSGRAVAATPVMLMTGSAIGPFLGGAVAQHFGYESLGWVVVALAAVSVGFFLAVVRGESRETSGVPKAA